jgi:hypothetical protein
MYIYIKEFCEREIYCHYAISGYHSNELLTVNTLNELKYFLFIYLIAYLQSTLNYME